MESNGSSDVTLWARSHQQVTVLGRSDDEDFGETFVDRADAGMPNVYRIRFADGYEGTAFEDELLTGPEHYLRPDLPDTRAVRGVRHLDLLGLRLAAAPGSNLAARAAVLRAVRRQGGTMAVSWHRRRTWENHMFGSRAAQLDFPVTGPAGRERTDSGHRPGPVPPSCGGPCLGSRQGPGLMKAAPGCSD